MVDSEENHKFDLGVKGLTPKISSVILLTVCLTVIVMLVWTIW